MNKLFPMAIVAATTMILGCQVEKTEEGEFPSVDVDGSAGQLPEYDVDVTQTQEGRLPDVDVDVDGGKLPEYQVTGPEITIGTQEKTVDVPTGVEVNVETEEKTFTVPDVDIDLPGDDDEDNQ